MIIMIQLKNVKKENNIISADYYPEKSDKCSKISLNILSGVFKGKLVGNDLETKSHLGHAKFALIDMRDGKRKIEDCTITWF